MNKRLTDGQIEELQKLLTDKKNVATIVAIVGALAAVISAIGTAVASIIIAIKAEG